MSVAFFDMLASEPFRHHFHKPVESAVDGFDGRIFSNPVAISAKLWPTIDGAGRDLQRRSPCSSWAKFSFPSDRRQSCISAGMAWQATSRMHDRTRNAFHSGCLPETTGPV